MNDYTHIAMVIDRSGSMFTGWKDVVGGYKQLIKDNKALDGKCTFTVAAFDTDYELLEDFTDIQEVDEELRVSPRGMTALLDAIGKTISTVGEELAKLKKKDRPDKVIMMVQTDGQENASKEFTKDAIKKMITEQTEKYAWQFMFLGATLEAVNEAQTWGFSPDSTSTYSTDKYSATVGLQSNKLTGMRCASTVEEYTAMATFSDEDREILNEDKKETLKG